MAVPKKRRSSPMIKINFSKQVELKNLFSKINLINKNFYNSLELSKEPILKSNFLKPLLKVPLGRILEKTFTINNPNILDTIYDLTYIDEKKQKKLLEKRIGSTPENGKKTLIMQEKKLSNKELFSSKLISSNLFPAKKILNKELFYPLDIKEKLNENVSIINKLKNWFNNFVLKNKNSEIETKKMVSEKLITKKYLNTMFNKIYLGLKENLINLSIISGIWLKKSSNNLILKKSSNNLILKESINKNLILKNASNNLLLTSMNNSKGLLKLIEKSGNIRTKELLVLFSTLLNLKKTKNYKKVVLNK